ncbi:hypothetical protein FDECE_3934 [Fusarium decemcellulare]|nr:hypothetical protein FDECE_3934 [Fusarium decemcellulare]
MASSRYHTLTNAELEHYFDRIRLPTKIRPNFMARTRSFLVDLDTITDILNYHLRDVPFESLALYYSQRRAIDVDTRSVYDKIVIQRRGGYGLEHNLLLNTVLLNLGLDAYMAGARLWDPKLCKYSGVEHCVNIVAIRGRSWLVDAGIGLNGPIKPVELANRAPFSHLDGTTGRIAQTPIAQAVRQDVQY